MIVQPVGDFPLELAVGGCAVALAWCAYYLGCILKVLQERKS